MQISLNRDVFLDSLSHVQGVIEKKSTLPILSNVLIEARGSKACLTSTDLDMIFVEDMSVLETTQEGSTTTSAIILYDIVRKLPIGSKIQLKLISESKLEIKSGNSKFNLLCLSPNDFPLSKEDFNVSVLELDPKKLLKLINKTKFSVSNDETRHYLNGIFLHKTKKDNDIFLTAASTDSHRMSVSNIRLNSDIQFDSIILPKKTTFQLLSLLEGKTENIKIFNNKSKIKFELKNCVLISKVIDGKFPNYNQVIPKNNNKKLEINLKDFINSVDRVISVSSDRKEGVKMELSNEMVRLSVNNPNSGDGSEILKAKFNSEAMNISFNSKYIMDVASQIEDENLIFNLSDSGSPVLLMDLSDPDSLFVVMPMKI